MGGMRKPSVQNAASPWRGVDDGNGELSTRKGKSRLSEPTIIALPVVRVFFPLDRRLHLAQRSLTPKTIEQALRMGVEIPSYRRAAEQFSELTHVGLSKSNLSRLVDEYGGKLVELQADEADAVVKVPKTEDNVTLREVPEPDSHCMNISMDGALIHIRGEGWKEVKIATISAVTHPVEPETGEWSMQLTQHSYRAGLWDAPEFAKQQWAEACQRGMEKAKYLSCVNDGTAWIWNIARMCYGHCVEILDWWHAVERLWIIGRQRFGPESPDGVKWVNEQKVLLADSRLRTVVHNVRQLFPRNDGVPEPVRQAIGYFFHNPVPLAARMRYKEFREAGYPTGSGTVEAACKVVAQTRLKQSGMRWRRSGAQAILALRSFLVADRWHLAASALALT
jgi:hypothetical protein